MSAQGSPTTPNANPAELAATASASSPVADTFDRMEYFMARYPTQSLGDRFSMARDLEHTRAPSPPPPRGFFEDTARDALSLNQPAHTFGPHLVTSSTGGISHVGPDGSFMRSSAGFEIDSMPGNYRSPFNHNMVYQAPGSGTRSFAQRRTTQAPPITLPPAPVASAPVLVPARQTRAVIPSPEASLSSVIQYSLTFHRLRSASSFSAP